MAEPTILDWNFTNWATVVLMVGVGFGLWAVAMKLWQRSQGQKKAA